MIEIKVDKYDSPIHCIESGYKQHICKKDEFRKYYLVKSNWIRV